MILQSTALYKNCAQFLTLVKCSIKPTLSGLSGSNEGTYGRISAEHSVSPCGRKYSSRTFRPQIQLLMTRGLTESACDRQRYIQP